MNLWMSGEIDVDVADSYRAARNALTLAINRKLEECEFKSAKFSEWAFISIIRKEDHPDFDEVIKKHSRDGSMEFRLKIPHDRFLQESEKGKQLLVTSALKRSIYFMEKLGVAADERAGLYLIVCSVEAEISADQ